MRENKTQFIMDNYIVVPNSALDKVTTAMNNSGIAYAVEPWPDEFCRVYVRKDASRVLKAIEKWMSSLL